MIDTKEDMDDTRLHGMYKIQPGLKEMSICIIKQQPTGGELINRHDESILYLQVKFSISNQLPSQIQSATHKLV
jgi:hypothetical protein